MQRIVCKNCGHHQIVSHCWFDPLDLSDQQGVWEQEYTCPKCKTVHTIDCAYTLDFDILNVTVNEAGDE